MRFRYEIAEQILDAFANTDTSEQKDFLRSYGLLKAVIEATALLDYPYDDEETARSLAWEDADVAFRGYGNELTTGAIMRMWNKLPRERWDEFRAAIRTAFRKARRASRDVPYHHHIKHRRAHFRDLDSGFALPHAIGCRSLFCRGICAELGIPLEYFPLLAEHIRERVEGRLQQPPFQDDPQPPKPHLRLVT